MHDESPTPVDSTSTPRRVFRRWIRARQDYLLGNPVGGVRRRLLSAYDIIRALLYQVGYWRVQQRAAGVAFFALIGLVPTLMVLVLFADLFGLQHLVGEFIITAVVQNFVPVETDAAQTAISEWVNNARTRTAGGIGIVGALYSSFNVYSGIHTLVNDLWQVRRRGRMGHQLKSAVYSGAGLLLLLAMNTILVAWVAAQLIASEFFGKLASFGLLFVLAFVGLKVMVDAKTELRYLARSALIGAVAFELSKYVFAFYVTQILTGSWFVIYGAIFLLPVFMLWCFVAVMIVALTASLAWILQNREQAMAFAKIPMPGYALAPDESPTDDA